MAIDWASQGYGDRIRWLLRVTYRPSGGGGDETLYLCNAAGHGSVEDYANGQVYEDVVRSVKTDEAWSMKDIAKGPIPQPTLSATLDLSEASSTLVTAITSGTFKNREVVLEAVECDINGRILNREEVWRGVGADRGIPEIEYPTPVRADARINVTIDAMGMEGLMEKLLPMQKWAVEFENGDYGGQERFDGATVPLVWARSWGVASGFSSGPFDGGNFHRVVVLESSAGGLTVGVHETAVDNNPNHPGTDEWLTVTGGEYTGLCYVHPVTTGNEGYIAVRTASGIWTISATYPKEETGWTKLATQNAFVAEFTQTAGPLSTKNRQWFANFHGRGSANGGPSNAIHDAEYVVDDLLTYAGASANWWYTGWPAALPDTVAEKSRDVVVSIPGVDPEDRIPKLKDVCGEILGLFGLQFVWRHDSANNDELRWQLAYRETPTTADHRFGVSSGLVYRWRYKAFLDQDANRVIVESAPYYRDIVVPTTGEIETTRQVLDKADSSQETVDGAAESSVVTYDYIRSGDDTSHDNAEVRWSTYVAAVNQQHLSGGVTQDVLADMGVAALACHLGEAVEWEGGYADKLVQGAIGRVWKKSITIDRDGQVSVSLVTRHGPFAYPTVET